MIVIPLGLASARWRRRLFPGLRGLSAGLASFVLGASALFAILQMLGSVGLFKRWPVTVACATLGSLAAFAAGSRRRTGAQRVEAMTLARSGPAVVAAALAIYVVALWSLGTFVALNSGPVESDTQTYHLSHAAKFVQEGWLTRLHFVTADNAIPYHPSNGETLQALGILSLGTDIASTLLNLLWAPLTILAAWAIGARLGHGPASASAVALVLATPVMVSTQSGSAMTDTMGLFFFLAAVSFVVTKAPRAKLIGGLAAGLALSTKLTFAAPVAFLTLAVLLQALRKRERPVRTMFAWGLPLLATGGFWYGRNAFLAGNPVPPLRIGVGDFALPKVPIDIVDRFGFSVADYLFDASVWRHSFLPGLRAGFGATGSIVAISAVVGALILIAKTRNDTIRVLAAVATLSAIAYAFTPTTALGPKGQPSLFTANLRYVTPAIALALAILPTLLSRLLHRSWIALAFPLLALTMLRIPEWPPETRGHAAKGAVVFAALSVLLWSARRAAALPKTRRLMVAALMALAVVAAGSTLQQRYAERRYTSAGGYSTNGTWDPAPFLWANGLQRANIGMAGFFTNYPLHGADLSNTVRYVGNRKADGEFTDYRSCTSWRWAVDQGSYDYLVLMPAFENQEDPPHVDWTRTSRGTELILEGKRAKVYRVIGRLDARGCKGQMRLRVG